MLDDSSLKARKLAEVEEVLCASPEYLKQRGVPGSPDELASHDIIAFRRHGERVLVSGSGRRTVFSAGPEQCRVVIDDGASQRLARVAGLGISMNADWNVDQAIHKGRLVRVLPDLRVENDIALWLVYPKSNVLTAKVRVLIDFLVEKIGRNPPWQR